MTEYLLVEARCRLQITQQKSHLTERSLVQFNLRSGLYKTRGTYFEHKSQLIQIVHTREKKYEVQI
jgi:hypothetical protein